MSPKQRRGPGRNSGPSGASGSTRPAALTAPRDTTAKSPAAAPERTARDGFARTVVAPALGVGAVAGLVAAKEGAAAWIALVAGLVVAGLVVGMIALKRGLYGR